MKAKIVILGIILLLRRRILPGGWSLCPIWNYRTGILYPFSLWSGCPSSMGGVRRPSGRMGIQIQQSRNLSGTCWFLLCKSSLSCRGLELGSIRNTISLEPRYYCICWNFAHNLHRTASRLRGGSWSWFLYSNGFGKCSRQQRINRKVIYNKRHYSLFDSMFYNDYNPP